MPSHIYDNRRDRVEELDVEPQFLTKTAEAANENLAALRERRQSQSWPRYILKGFQLSKRGLALSRMFMAATHMYDFLMMIGSADMFLSNDGLVPVKSVSKNEYFFNMFTATTDLTASRCLLAGCMFIQWLWFIGAPGFRFWGFLCIYFRFCLMKRMTVYDGPTHTGFIWHAYLLLLPHGDYWSLSALMSNDRTDDAHDLVREQEQQREGRDDADEREEIEEIDGKKIVKQYLEFEEDRESVTSVVTYCYVLNIWTIYLGSFFVKLGMVPSFVAGEELWYVLLNNLHGRLKLTKPFLAIMPNVLVRFLSHATCALEASAPLISCWGLREVMVLSFMGLHTGIGIFMDVGSFFMAMFAILLPLLPGRHFVVLDDMINPTFDFLRKIWSAQISPIHRWTQGTSAAHSKGIASRLFFVLSSMYAVHMFLAGVYVHNDWMRGQKIESDTDAEGRNISYISQETWDGIFGFTDYVSHSTNPYVKAWVTNKHFGVHSMYHTAQKFNMFCKKTRHSFWYPQLGVLENGHVFPVRIGNWWSQRWAHDNEVLPEVFTNATHVTNATHSHNIMFENADTLNGEFWSNIHRTYWTHIRESEGQLLEAGSWICNRYRKTKEPDAPKLESVFFLQVRHQLSPPGNFSVEEQAVLYWLHWCVGDSPPPQAHKLMNSMNSFGVKNTKPTDFGYLE